MDDDEEDEAFLPDDVKRDASNVKVPSIVIDDDHHQWETIETVVINGQDIDVDAGVILGDDDKKPTPKRRLRRGFKSVGDGDPSFFETFWCRLLITFFL
jgi:hypothetical protein